MAQIYNAHNIFSVNIAFRVLIYRKYQYTVRPNQVKTHLNSTIYRVAGSEAQYIHSVIQQWDDIDEEAQIDNWPSQIDKPIPDLSVYKDGLLCRQCEIYICRQIGTMKMHWLKAHGYRVQQDRGRPTPAQARVIQTAIDHYIQPVLCQRIFAQGSGSHYIYIVPPHRQAVVSDPVSDTETIRQLLQTVAEYQQEDQQAQNTTIQAGELDEATPWLNRTG